MRGEVLSSTPRPVPMRAGGPEWRGEVLSADLAANMAARPGGELTEWTRVGGLPKGMGLRGDVAGLRGEG